MKMAHDCKVQKLIAEAVQVVTRLDEVDALSVRPGVQNMDQVFTEVDDCHRKLMAIDEEAASHYATSETGAVFQIGVAERAVSIMDASALSTEQQRKHLQRIRGVLRSLKRYMEISSARSPGKYGSVKTPAELATVAARVKAALARSGTWTEAQAALAEHDLEYAPAGGGLSIRVRSTKRYVCKASAAGPGYTPLMRKFGVAFPGHPATWLTERARKTR